MAATRQSAAQEGGQAPRARRRKSTDRRPTLQEDGPRSRPPAEHLPRRALSRYSLVPTNTRFRDHPATTPVGNPIPVPRSPGAPLRRRQASPRCHGCRFASSERRSACRPGTIGAPSRALPRSSTGALTRTLRSPRRALQSVEAGSQSRHAPTIGLFATIRSRANRARRSASAANSGGRTFSATSRPSAVSRARYTSPVPPAPIGPTTS